MNNNKEVGCLPDDNSTIRLPGTLNGEPTYSPSSDYAKSTKLDAADTGGVVGMPSIGLGYGMPSMNSNVSVTNEGTTLMATVGDSETNLSAKYKYPNVSQDIPSKGQLKTQYNDHS